MAVNYNSDEFRKNDSEVKSTYTWKINKINRHLLYLEKKRPNNPAVIDSLIDYWLERLSHYLKKEEIELKRKNVEEQS